MGIVEPIQKSKKPKNSPRLNSAVFLSITWTKNAMPPILCVAMDQSTIAYIQNYGISRKNIH